MKSLNRVAGFIAVIAIGAGYAWSITAQSRRTFAGWIRSANCTVQVWSKPARAISLAARASSTKRLHAGDRIKASGPGSARLLVYGKEVNLTASRGWYDVPDDARKVAGQSIYRDYVSRAGQARGEEVSPENVWRTIGLTDLQNPDPAKSLKVRMRLVPSKKVYEIGETVSVEVCNDNSVPMFVSLMDIDCAASVDMLTPQLGNHQEQIAAQAKWARLKDQFKLDLPEGWKEGVEHFRIIASTKRLDLSALRTKTMIVHDENLPVQIDPLVNFIQAAGGSKSASPGKWATAGVDFTIRNSAAKGMP